MSRITGEVRIRDRKIFDHYSKYGPQSLRKTAQATGLTKDSVARGLAALHMRNKYPESQLWETEEGQTWLHRLVIATLYEFGIKGNLGADRICEFFKRIRIDTHVAISPSTLRKLIQPIEEEVCQFQKKQEKEQAQKGPKVRQIVASGDETFFNDKMLLVLMELSSGYLVMEEEAKDRTYDTWQAKAQLRVKQLGLQVRHFISDRGKSLIKLATTAFGCEAGADIFHAQQDISKWLGRALYGQLGRAYKQLNDSQQKLASLKEKEAEVAKIIAQQERVEHSQKIVSSTLEGRQAYREAQQSVSAAVHAFSVEDNKPQSSKQVESRLEEQAQCFKEIAKKYSASDQKDSIGKFKRQIKDVASIVDIWWLWVAESNSDLQIGEDMKQWLLYILLPVIYWYHQRQKSDSTDMKRLYEAAWRQAQVAYANHPVTATVKASELKKWQSWGEWACANFQRASSAVEGRNGTLAQSYHNRRGFTNQRLAALTTIHNYDTKRRDGSTPAQRLYGQPFPDLFEWLLDKMGPLPLPRQAREYTQPDPFLIKSVAA